ncbi:hypothetical protein [Brachymonas denitrificans]|jgi:hypothetical protein|uniref:Uncharacterized protein n=1 Tax=Brachymonas denitrificans DSM 15123 TaxID=1121117 RepID=A0A1H8IYC1_9BURK|nr:hypothetical protein [Brachymonas denitrificans]SEN73451.1 hypothetical protein SAMN02745977_01905 [Brachymonas denitrificans DSM 15123]
MSTFQEVNDASLIQLIGEAQQGVGDWNHDFDAAKAIDHLATVSTKEK